MILVANAFYTLLLVLMSPMIIYRFIRHGRYKSGWRERFFGFTLPCPNESISSSIEFSRHENTVWLHGVSVGEIQLLRVLVEQFEAERPDLKLAISTATDTGYQLAKTLFSKHTVFYAPLDFSWAIRNTLDALTPSLIVLVELELWPNWIQIAKEREIPVVIVNGRLSQRSFRGYHKARWFTSKFLKKLTWIGAQDAAYRDRFIQLGVAAQCVTVTGSIKFDNAEFNRDHPEIVARRSLLNLTKDNIVWVIGSTQSPEEEVMLSVFQRLERDYERLRLIVVPRHAERFEEVAAMIEKSGNRFARRSQIVEGKGPQGWKIFLGDSIGELRWWWGLADIGFVGGSFGNRGGQNMIEPCALGVATSFGPNTVNFRDIVQLLIQNKAVRQFRDVSEVEPWMREMLTDSQGRMELGRRAAGTVANQKGAVARTWKGFEPYLPSPPASNSDNA